MIHIMGGIIVIKLNVGLFLFGIDLNVFYIVAPYLAILVIGHEDSTHLNLFIPKSIQI